MNQPRSGFNSAITALRNLGHRRGWTAFRSLVTRGELQHLVDEDSCGVTSNPSVFEKAIKGGTDYANALKAMESQGNLDPQARYEHLRFAMLRRPPTSYAVYGETKIQNGYVRLEVL